MEYRERPYPGEEGWRPFNPFRSGRRLSQGVKCIILVTVAVHFVVLLLLAGARLGSGSSLAAANALYNWLTLSPADVFGRGFVWQLVTYAFLHAPTSIFHILFNMLLLYWFGREIEGVWGTKRFVLFYLTAAAFAAFVFSIVQMFLRAAPSYGASGAVMAVLMVYALWWPNRTVLFMLFFPMRIRTCIIILVVMDTFGFLRMSDNIAHMAHLGGLLYGYLVVRFGPRLAQFAAGIGKGAGPAGGEEERRLDEVLDKVHRHGIHALSWRERRFLKKMSKR